MDIRILMSPTRVRGFVMVLLILACLSFYFLHDSHPKRETISIRQKRPLDVSTIILNDEIKQKLWEENKLRPLVSRGATIFADENGTIRIPPEDVVQRMEFRDLEELYHRYVESIQAICPRQIHLGSLEDGGYDLCQDESVLPSKPCLVYSFGVRTDFSFDEQISALYGCEVHSFDPANGMRDHKHSDKVFFHSLGLGDRDRLTENDWTLRTLNTIKTQLGHTEHKLEILKIDIEGGEWLALPEMMDSGALRDVKQLIMEFHSFVDLDPWVLSSRNKVDYRHHLGVFRRLYEEGFRIFYFKRFPAKCCMFYDEFNVLRTGCHEVHLMRVKT